MLIQMHASNDKLHVSFNYFQITSYFRLQLTFLTDKELKLTSYLFLQTDSMLVKWRNTEVGKKVIKKRIME